MRTVIDTLGDTVVVRTVGAPNGGFVATLTPEVTIGMFSGPDEYIFGQVTSIAVGPDGSIYAYDAQVPALRKFASDGTYVATFGRQGNGPGEYEQATGLAVAPDGRVFLHDPRNVRVNVYSPEGESLAHIRVPSSLFTSNTLLFGTEGDIYAKALLGEIESGRPWPIGFIHYDSTGALLDSIPPPDIPGPPPPLMTAEGEMVRAQLAVPFHPRPEWTFTPLGYFVTGTGERYEVTVHRPDRPLRIERELSPAAVDPEEAEQHRARIERRLLDVQPGWRWDGPDVPSMKPYFKGLYTGLDGRIWVYRYVQAEPVVRDSVTLAADTTGELSPRYWREPIVFDVFEPDGRFLGEVHMPQGARLSVMAGGQAWGIVRDSLDVQYIRRWQVDFPLAPTETRTAAH
ncbi:MAG: 6-bladed beta-propeller [Longimicrobiales bacterium]